MPAIQVYAYRFRERRRTILRTRPVTPPGKQTAIYATIATYCPTPKRPTEYPYWMPMDCVVYKSRRQPDHYLYVERADDFSRVPPALTKLLGQLELVMSLTLSDERGLAQADPREVRRQLVEQGYYLQLPPNRQSAT
jgi:uncharacterized protein YcgL (UPF0745 family)